MKRIAGAVISLVMILALMTGCGGTKGPLQGTWKDSLLGIFTLTFSGTNKVHKTTTSNVSDKKEETDGTYTLSGDTVRIEYDDEKGVTYTYKYDSNAQTLEWVDISETGVKFIFKKIG